jgi:hypothetical protein
MSKEIAKGLQESGRAHALSSQLLYVSAMGHAEEHGMEDPEQFAFNGTYSLSIHYLVGLGLELMLKSAYVAHGGEADDGHLRREIGHDVLRALNVAEERGFVSEAPYLREIVELLREPYKAHYFRYSRPEQIPLPEYGQVIELFTVLDAELDTLLE